MKKELIIGIFVLFIVGISGCTEQSESIKAILQKANNIGDVYYEIDALSSTEVGSYFTNHTSTMKVWQKTPYMKTETTSGSLTSIMVYRPDGAYSYNNKTQNYTKFLSLDNETQLKFFYEMANEMMESQTLKVLGTDTIDEKSVTIIKYTYNVSGIMPLSSKCWIWDEKGIPLRVETNSTVENFKTSMIMEYNNFVFEEIPESIFDVS